MECGEEQRAIAEKYLDQMIAADAAKDYDAFLVPFDPTEQKDSDFTKEYFDADADEMLEEAGGYKSREFLCCINGDDSSYAMCLRFVWKGKYEKKDFIIIVGIHQRDGDWYAHEGMWH